MMARSESMDRELKILSIRQYVYRHFNIGYINYVILQKQR